MQHAPGSNSRGGVKCQKKKAGKLEKKTAKKKDSGEYLAGISPLLPWLCSLPVHGLAMDRARVGRKCRIIIRRN
jgi:hypothetical protein